MAAVEKILTDQEVESMISDMARRWKSHRSKKESLERAFDFVKSEGFKTLPVEVRVLILKGAFYINRTLPRAEGGELE
jgi:hypothetical protein